MKQHLELKDMVSCALFISLIILGSHISIPIPVGPVPITLADFFVMLAGMFLTVKNSLITIILYLTLGLIGLPVFSNGNSGFAFFLGPTGGFLLGYIFLATVISLTKSKVKKNVLRDVTAIIIGNFFLYGIGLLWLYRFIGNGYVVLATGLIPFLPGSIIKIIVVLMISKTISSKSILE